MATYILKLSDDDKDYYLEWSTVVDAPTTYGMSRREFTAYYRRMYGESEMLDFEERMARVDRKGTSALIEESADDVIRGNRAGKDETRLTKQQIIEHFCRNRPTDDEQEPELPRGKRQ